MRKQLTFIVLAVLLLITVTADLSAQAKRMLLIAPRQISPANNSHLTHFPRTLSLRWQELSNATYEVEIDCMHCRNSGQWDSDNGPATHVKADIAQNFYSYTFPGDNPGRWRVRAKKGLMVSGWSPWWLFDFKTGPGGGGGNQSPDLIVRNIRLTEGCKIEVTIKNIGAAGVPDSYYDLPSAVSVQMYNGPKPWGGIILKGFDPNGKLKNPGGEAVHLWFPDTANLKLGPGAHSLRVEVDNNKVLQETNEANNSLTVQVNCKPGLSIDPGRIGHIPPIGPAPQRFFIDFRDCYLVYAHSSNTLQIAAQSNVLSYGGDWDRSQMKPYLYALRLKTWAGFWWKINTSRKEVYQITGVPFGQMGGTEKAMPIVVEPQGSPDNPSQFLLRFKNAYLAYDVPAKSIQVIAELIVLSYGGDFEKCNHTTSLYQLRQNVWQGFFWEVNTVEKAAYRVNGGAFCSAAGSKEKLNVSVRVVN